MDKGSAQYKWLHKKIPDATMLSHTDTLKNSKKGRKLLIIPGSHIVQYLDYKRFIDAKDYDVLSMNQSYLLPHMERATYHFHGSMGYILSFTGSSAFKYFCEGFSGEHIFMSHTAHCVNGAYAVCKADVVRKCIAVNNISKYKIVTHFNGLDIQRYGYAHIPPLAHFTPSKLPYGALGTLNAMVMPFALQLGYSMIVIAGVGHQDQRHFYDVSYIQPHLHKPYAHSLINTTLSRWGKWRKMGEANGTKIVVIPAAKIEPAVKKILICLPSGKVK